MSKTRIVVEIEVEGPEYISEEHILGVVRQRLMLCYGDLYKTQAQLLMRARCPETGLALRTLRKANTARIGHFKNAHGALAHPPPHSDGSNWSVLEWLGATLGELGEAANIAKKMHRGDLLREDALPLLAQEISDTITYLDLTAMQLGISLDDAVAETFNRVSARVGSSVLIALDSRGYFVSTSDAD